MTSRRINLEYKAKTIKQQRIVYCQYVKTNQKITQAINKKLQTIT